MKTSCLGREGCHREALQPQHGRWLAAQAQKLGPRSTVWRPLRRRALLLSLTVTESFHCVTPAHLPAASASRSRKASRSASPDAHWASPDQAATVHRPPERRVQLERDELVTREGCLALPSLGHELHLEGTRDNVFSLKVPSSSGMCYTQASCR